MLNLVHHKNLDKNPQNWYKFSLMEQLANIGTDVARAIRYKNAGKNLDSELAFERSLELIYLTVEDPKNKKRLKEILRVKECWIDYFCFNNEYKTDERFWLNYFYNYNYAAAIQKIR